MQDLYLYWSIIVCNFYWTQRCSHFLHHWRQHTLYLVKSKTNNVISHSLTRGNHGWNSIAMSSTAFPTFQYLRNKFSVSSASQRRLHSSQSVLCFVPFWYIEVHSEMRLCLTHNTLYSDIMLTNWPSPLCWTHHSGLGTFLSLSSVLLNTSAQYCSCFKLRSWLFVWKITISKCLIISAHIFNITLNNER